MANRNIFSTLFSGVSAADAINEAGGVAYRLTAEQALAQFSATGCFNDTYYASAETQLDDVRKLAFEVDVHFLAQCAVYARQRGGMKDAPAFLCAVLAKRDPAVLASVFDRVIDNGKMLRNFVQMVRSGVTGRRSLGTAPKRMVRGWFEARTCEEVFRQSVGQQPSMADVLKLARPKPSNRRRSALYGYMIGKSVDTSVLPPLVQTYEAYKATRQGELPKVPFQMLTALDLDREAWTAIANNASWQMTRMNLNTFLRHGVFEDAAMVDRVAQRLRDPLLVKKAKVFPYQLLSAYLAAEDAPKVIREALQDAMEIAIDNVPSFEGRVVVCPDVSGSMGSPATGYLKGSTSKVRCIDVAALMAAAVLRKNPRAEVLPFDFNVKRLDINPRDSVMSNAQRLTNAWGGGTNCAAPLRYLNRRRQKADLVIYVSDNESWLGRAQGHGTSMMEEWTDFKRHNRGAKLVCIDIQPYSTTQASSQANILNVGGFSDAVFDVVAAFAKAKGGADHWVRNIMEVRV